MSLNIIFAVVTGLLLAAFAGAAVGALIGFWSSKKK